MDTLSEVLANSHAERVVPSRFLLRAPWSLHSAGVPGMLVRTSRGAPYWIARTGHPPLEVNAGDLVIFAPNVANVITSDLALTPTPLFQFSKSWRGKLDLVNLDFGGCGADTQIFSVLIWLSAYFRHSILNFIPPVIILRHEEIRLSVGLSDLLCTSVPQMFDRPAGWGVSRLRLAELAVVSVLGDYFSRKTTLQSADGWLRGLTDPAIARSIGRIHSEPHRDWTIEKLARVAAMSRSRFSARFKSLVGSAPIEYLTTYRMISAIDQIERKTANIAEISRKIGYKTEKGFIRAFHRWSGLTPSSYVRRERGKAKIGPS
jgi:AraC-like DNA-binding protein